MGEAESFPTTPRVSVIMANYRGADHLPAAIESVLAQTLSNLELIVVDDASPDESVDVVWRFAAADSRIRLIVADSNHGPGAARNRALDIARGDWIAIVDSDDILHAERLERLIARGEELAADAIADDLLHFSEVDALADRTLLGATAQNVPKLVSVAQFIRSNSSEAGLPPLGYLKPVIRRSALGTLRYDENIRIAEDYDFLLRLLLEGAKLMLVSDPLYLYRRHPASLSHRLSVPHMEAMIANHRALYARGYELPPSTRALLDYRLEALRKGLAYERLVAKLKQREVLSALLHLFNRPSLLWPLMRSLRERRASRKVIGKARSRNRMAIVVTSDPAFEPTVAARMFLRRHDDAAIEMIVVPPYGMAGRDAAADQALWCRLADISVASDVTVVAHGLAGMYASSFMPVTSSVTALIDRPEEEPSALRWARARRMRILRPDGSVLADSTGIRPMQQQQMRPEGGAQVLPQAAASVAWQ